MATVFRLTTSEVLVIQEPHDVNKRSRRKVAQRFIEDLGQVLITAQYVIPKRGITILVWLEDHLPEDALQHFHDVDVFLAPTRQAHQHRVLLMPDFYFIDSYGYESLKTHVANVDREWSKKSKTVYWRGSSTGKDRCKTNTRVQLCKRYGKTHNVALSRLLPHHIPEALGLLDQQRDLGDFLEHRYVVDVDGFSCSWDGLFWKMLSSSVVLKFTSREEQWYYRYLRPWIHYIPCTLDNFSSRVKWCREHDDACKEIAERASRFAHSLTYENQVDAFAHHFAAWAGLEKRRQFSHEKRANRELSELLAKMSESKSALNMN